MHRIKASLYLLSGVVILLVALVLALVSWSIYETKDFPLIAFFTLLLFVVGAYAVLWSRIEADTPDTAKIQPLK